MSWIRTQPRVHVYVRLRASMSSTVEWKVLSVLSSLSRRTLALTGDSVSRSANRCNGGSLYRLYQVVVFELMNQ